MGPELRGAIYDLRVEEERNKPLPESLRILVELGRRMNPDLDIRLDVADGFPDRPLGERSAELLRILQEALTNVRRHSGARNATVSLMVEEYLLVAEVADDGRGFSLSEWSPAGMGTRGMRERARTLKGDLKIESEPGKGTKVRFETPLKRQPEDPEEEIRVLLVEDHASFRQAAASIFERVAGFEVIGQGSRGIRAQNGAVRRAKRYDASPTHRGERVTLPAGDCGPDQDFEHREAHTPVVPFGSHRANLPAKDGTED
jgi:hypothetical protein